MGLRSYQQRVADWVSAGFPPSSVSDRTERSHRLLEESLELAQASGCSEEDAIALVRYPFPRTALLETSHHKSPIDLRRRTTSRHRDVSRMMRLTSSPSITPVATSTTAIFSTVAPETGDDLPDPLHFTRKEPLHPSAIEMTDCSRPS